MLAKNYSVANLSSKMRSMAACRPFSVYEKTFMADDLVIKPAEKLKQKPGPDHVYTFGGITTDYMLEIDYDRENGGWQRPQIVENKPFQLMPENATLNFSIECFEGAKAYKTVDKRVMMYRFDQNARRMNSSHTQLGIPNFDIHQMTQAVKKLVEIEKDWIPEKPMHSLYLRPTSMSMDNRLGLSRINKSKTFVILSPVGPYYPRGFVPVKLYCDTTAVRAWPTGFGDKKIGGNYAPSLVTQRLGNEVHGCDQALWLIHDYVTEVGTMNFFMYWKNDEGVDELITPPLDGTILPGITRDSILKITEELKEFKVVQKPFKIQDVMKAVKEGRVYEAFGSGTAAIVSPVKSFNYKGTTYEIPINEETGCGPLTSRVLQMMLDLQYGVTKRPDWQVDVCGY